MTTALFTHNKHPFVTKWKGDTFTQLTSTIHKNADVTLDTSYSVHRLFKPLPSKVYRREIASHGSNSSVCNPRTSMSIDELTRPGGYIVTDSNPAGDLAGIVNLELPNNSTELGTPACNTAGSCFSPAYNARRRVRSAGMIKNKFKDGVAAYYTNTQQYLTSRNESYDRNMFHYQTNGETTPGTKCTLSATYKPSNNRFKVQGGVSSSDYITRRNYDTITNVGASYRTTFGDSLANAMAYGVPNSGGTNIKEKTGYPNKVTPMIPGACPKMYNG
jgi:hypothetical protein